MTPQSPYSAAFFDRYKDASSTSASIVLPHVLSLCNPKSVVDFGSGVGTWLRAVLELGVEDIAGVDGDYVRDELLLIPRDRFIRADITKPVDLERTFDLAISLEVAEHLPNDKASIFVDTLTRHSKVLLFSAAVPLQGGTNHVNEQWPQYWNLLFKGRGYTCVDCLRDVFWEDERIAWWYRQNMLIFVSDELLTFSPKLMAESMRPRRLPLALVHPGFMKKLEKEQIGLMELLKQIPGALRADLSKHSISPN